MSEDTVNTYDISSDGLALIKHFEGCILAAYDDYDDKVVQPGCKPRGVLTIGWGHTTVAGPPPVFVGQVITQDVADAILHADLQPVVMDVRKKVLIKLLQCEFDALVSFQFNTGWLDHPSCSLLKHLNEGDMEDAAANFNLYDEASGRVVQGLVKRRRAEADMFLGRDWQTDKAVEA